MTLTAVDALDSERVTLLDLADRLLDKGVVLSGEARISVAGVDLVYLALDLVVSAVETIERNQRRRGPASRPGASDQPAGGASHRPGGQANASLARNVPGERPVADQAGVGPGAMASAEAGAMASAETAGVSATAGKPEEARAHIGDALPSHIDVAPDEVERGLAKLVLTLVEFLRQLLERQAVRRMEGGSLSDDEVERVGVALMRLERKVGEMAATFGLRPDELNVDLGPLGRLR